MIGGGGRLVVGELRRMSEKGDSIRLAGRRGFSEGDPETGAWRRRSGKVKREEWGALLRRVFLARWLRKKDRKRSRG